MPPNQPATPGRNIRIPDRVWKAALAKADERGEVLSEVIRDFLADYAGVRRPERTTDRDA